MRAWTLALSATWADGPQTWRNTHQKMADHLSTTLAVRPSVCQSYSVCMHASTRPAVQRIPLQLIGTKRRRPNVTTVSQKIPPEVIWIFLHFFHKRLRIFNRFFTHLLHVSIYARLQVFIQLSLTLTKLCHIKRDYIVHVICSKCPKRAKTRAFRRLRKSLIALLIVVCGKSL